MDNFKLGGGKDDSAIEKTFPSLTFLAARLVYYINLNCMFNLEKTVIDAWECNCNLFSGFRKINGIRDYCDLCSLNIKHQPSQEEESNFKVKNLVNKHISLINDFKNYSHVSIYEGDYVSKCSNLYWTDGTFSEWSLYDSIFNGYFFTPEKFYKS